MRKEPPPLIQIEQDSPEVIEATRKQIANMAAAICETPGNLTIQQGRVMHASGYLSALMLHELISRETYTRLQSELWQARDAAWAEEDGAAQG
ncbi:MULTISPECIES: hypothetical protein [Pseudomonas]|uniref:hypothetical protein n=1 Tax=Pseudomonas TaxID=286 RepID=UPI0014765057|nr:MULTISPECIES: hypothetical protein [Pseudomonas]MBM1204772.1 hypothetical protein [Pseudomonas fragi]MBM1204868.1 hypothetical protein [Pseudomonas fragi]NMY57948.1 hypothetical protein [Pseudomonas sp. WS 5051]